MIKHDLEFNHRIQVLVFRIILWMLCIATWKFTLTKIIIVIFWLFQQIAFKNLVQRNREMEQTQGPPASNSAIQLPFIIVNTSKKTVIDCSISNDK
jgi:hypothetical protein